MKMPHTLPDSLLPFRVMQVIAERSGQQENKLLLSGNPAVTGCSPGPVILRHHLSVALPFTEVQLKCLWTGFCDAGCNYPLRIRLSGHPG
jgi:hypothetical protein